MFSQFICWSTDDISIDEFSDVLFKENNSFLEAADREKKSDWIKIITSQENIMNINCYNNQIDNWIAVQWSSMLFL